MKVTTKKLSFCFIQLFGALLLGVLFSLVFFNGTVPIRHPFVIFQDSNELTNDSVLIQAYQEKRQEVLDSAVVKRNDSHCPIEGLLLGDSGRFGNMFFEYLGARMMAIVYNLKLYVTPGFQQFFERYFIGQRGITFNENYFVNQCLIKQDFWNSLHLNNFDMDNVQVPLRHRFIRTAGYPLDVRVNVWKFLFKYRDIFLREFQWKDDFLDRVRAHVSNVTSGREYSILVGIHVRLTDFIAHTVWLDGGIYQAKREYFDRTKQYFKDRYKDPLFLVISDDLVWCEKHLNDTDVVFAGNKNEGDPGWDLAVSSLCDHVILTYGSFTSTIGYFNTGEVVIADNFSSRPDQLNERIKESKPPKWKWFPVWLNYINSSDPRV